MNSIGPLCILAHIVSIVGSLCDREVACSASDRQGSNFDSCVWRTALSQSSHQPQEVLLAQFSLYVHKGCLKPDSFHFYWPIYSWLVVLTATMHALEYVHSPSCHFIGYNGCPFRILYNYLNFLMSYPGNL